MTQRRFLTRGKAVAAAALVSVPVLGATPAMAGPVTGLTVTSTIFGATTAACAASMGPQAVFTGVACAAGWIAMGVSWLLPF